MEGVTTVVGESLIGSFQFNSSNFDSSQFLIIAGQPVGMGLGAGIPVGQPKANVRYNVNMGMKSTCTINTVFNVGIAPNASYNFIHAIGYTKV